MQKSTEVEFKSLLTREEYERLMDQFKGNRTDLQTNHYFDTSRFSLKALRAAPSFPCRRRESRRLEISRRYGDACPWS